MNMGQIFVYAFLGALTYGFVKGLLKSLYEEFSLARHNWTIETGCIFLALTGPFGYIVSFSAAIMTMLARGYKVQVCFSMPNELWVKPAGKGEK